MFNWHALLKECLASQGNQIAANHKWMCKPHVSRGYIYATDGVICVRRSTRKRDTDLSLAVSPADFQWSSELYQEKGIPLPEVCQTGHCVICPECDGAGCDDCSGLGSVTNTFVVIGRGKITFPLQLATKYIRLLRRYDIAEVFLRKASNSRTSVRFCRPPIEGLLAPVLPPVL